MTWGPIDADWGKGWEDFDTDPFADDDAADRDRHRHLGGRRGTVSRLPRRDRRGQPLDRSLTAPRPTRPTRAPRPTIELDHRRIRDARDARLEPTVPSDDRPEPAPDRTEPRRSRSGRSRSGRSRTTRSSGRESAPTTRPALRLVQPASSGGGGRPPRTGRRRGGRPDPRHLVVASLLGLLLVAVVAKLIHVQVVEPDRFVAAGEEQRLRVVTLEANRGRILDREGRDLALSVLEPSVFADPGQIDDPAAVAARIAPLLRLDTAEVTADLSRDTRFVFLSRRVDDRVAERVVELDLPGIHLMEEPSRYTPAQNLARSVIGAVADDQTGSTGIELLYDDVLTGTPGELRYERAPDGNTIAAGGESRIAPQAGSDVVVTLDRSLQYETERVLAEQVDALGAKGGIVIISQPGTGDILALANITRNTDDEIITAGANRAVIDVFEPGSVNKVITISAALEEGLVEPDTTLEVPWQLPVSDHVFTDYQPHATRDMTVTEILAQSSNIGTIKLGQQLGKERIDRYLRAFGFGEATSLGFPNESRGLLLDPERWSGTSIGSIPLGQGIAVTAMQMLAAYNVVANDGVYVEPRLVAASVDGDGVRHDAPVVESRRVVSEETAAQVRAMLVQVVEEGTGKQAAVDGYSVGGKTGTARKPQENGTYRDGAGNYHYVAAFTGIVPVEDPQLSMIVVIDEPTSTIYGGAAAAPVFADLASFALNRFRIPPVACTTCHPDGTALSSLVSSGPTG